MSRMQKRKTKTGEYLLYMPALPENNYLNVNSLVKVCSSCGWNMTIPYMSESFHLVILRF